MYTTCMPGALSGQKRRLQPLELESKMVVSHCVGVRNQTLGPLQEQYLLLTIEPYLQPPIFLFLEYCSLSLLLRSFPITWTFLQYTMDQSTCLYSACIVREDR